MRRRKAASRLVSRYGKNPGSAPVNFVPASAGATPPRRAPKPRPATLPSIGTNESFAGPPTGSQLLANLWRINVLARHQERRNYAHTRNTSPVNLRVQIFHGGVPHRISALHYHRVDAARSDRRHQILIEAH